MSAPAGSYPSMGPRNVMNEAYTTNPDVNHSQFKQTNVTAGAPQSPVQAAPEGHTLDSTNQNNVNMSTGHPYNQSATEPAGGGHAYTGPAQSTTDDGTATCGDTAGKNVHGVFKGIHVRYYSLGLLSR